MTTETVGIKVANRILLLNLASADILMGVYLLSLGVVGVMYSVGLYYFINITLSLTKCVITGSLLHQRFDMEK